MKKILSLTMVLAMALSFAACGSKAPDGNGSVGNNVSVPAGKAADSKDAKLISYKEEDGELIFTLDKSIPLTEDSWLGICEKGNYVLEDDADDAGIAYSYFEDRDSGNEDYVFKIAYAGFEDGEYTMVLCDTDNKGYVMASWTLTLKNEKPSVDLSGFKISPRPADLPTPAAPAENVDPDEDDGDFDEGEYEDGGEEPDDGAADA